MISNEQIRVMCTELVAERDPERLNVLLGVMKTLCTQYVEERSMFLTPAKATPQDRSRYARATKPEKKAA